jgi:hypothetical protein
METSHSFYYKKVEEDEMQLEGKINAGYDRKIKQRRYCKGRLLKELSLLKQEFNESIYWNNYRTTRIRKKRDIPYGIEHVLQDRITGIEYEEVMQGGPNYLIIYNTGKVSKGKFRVMKYGEKI